MKKTYGNGPAFGTTAPRWSNVTAAFAPESVVSAAAFMELAMLAELGPPPATSVVLLVTNCVGAAGELIEICHVPPFCWNWQVIGVFRRMASKRVSFSMPESCVAALFS